MRINTECEQCGAVINTKIKKASSHLVSVKCVFCGDVSEYEIDKENGVEKKLNNYSKNVDKLHKKIDNQKNEITRLQDKLNVANGIVAKQIDEIKRLNNILDDKNEKFITEINKYEKHYENQLNVQDNELKRRLTIIHYLEEKLFKGDE